MTDPRNYAQRQKAHGTLIHIAQTSTRLHTGFARADANLQGVSACTRLEKIVVASRAILAKSLANHDDSSFNDRLEGWLCGDEPDECLQILRDMERLITDFGGMGRTLWSKVSAVYPIYSGGRISEAIKLFNDRQASFHLLLTLEVWNCEIDIRSQPGTAHGEALTATCGGYREQQKNEMVDSKKLDSILEWLDGFNCSERNEDVISLRQSDTCRWLSETDQYKLWRNTDDSFLWLQGKAGAGKTVLAASVIEEIRNTLQDGEVIVFFYCDFRDERTTGSAAILRSILSQLLRKLRNATGQDPIQLIDDISDGQTEGTLVLNRARGMVRFVSRAARQFSRQPTVVLDALDECRDIECLLHALHEMTNCGMRLFVTSRPLQVIKDKFHKLPSISMDRMAKEVSADIGLHIIRMIDGDRRLRIFEEKVKMEIHCTLQYKADGMFRWVQCQIDALRRCATARDVRTALYSLPSSLDETYERILRAIDPQSSDGRVALRSLIWLVVAFRPMRLVEIIEALSIDLHERKLDREFAPVHEYALLDALGSLVVYNEDTDVVNLSHFSVKEYLVGMSSLMNLSGVYHVDLQRSHAQVALLCMCYVAVVTKYWALFETETRFRVLSDQRNDTVISKSHPLLHYAFSHGFHHLLHVQSGNHFLVIDGMIDLRSDTEWHSVGWQCICGLATSCLRLPFLSGLTARHDFIVCIMISLLPEPFLRALLGRSPFKALNGTSPLIYATYFDKIGHAKTLLSLGVSHVNRTGLDIDGPRQVLPLEVAFRYRHHSLFDLFLSDWRVTVPPRLFSSVFHEHYLEYTPRDAIRLLQCDEFAEWVQDDGRGEQSLLRASDYSWGLIMQSASEKEVLTLLRRLFQVGYVFSGPNALKFVLAVVWGAASQRSLQLSVAVVLYLSSLDVPIPSRALLISRTTLLQELTLRGLDVKKIMTRGDIAFRNAFGECKYGFSRWAPDCNSCSASLRVMGLQRYAPIDVLLVGRKGVGKSTLVNMIIGAADNLPGAAQVPAVDESTLQITSYATLLGSLPVQIWDTPGLDEAQDDHHVRDKINGWLRQVLSSHCEQDLVACGPYVSVPIIQVVWCMHAEEIRDRVAWQRVRAVDEECRRLSRVTTMVLVNRVTTPFPEDLEVRRQSVFEESTPSAIDVPLKRIRSHAGMSSREYEEDSQALCQFIHEHALQNLPGGFEDLPLSPSLHERLDPLFRCTWMVTLPESICNYIVRPSNLRGHLRMCHGVELSSKLVVTCLLRGCNRSMRSGSLVRHILGVHLRQTYACTNCSVVYSRADVLRAHLKKYHGNLIYRS